MSLYGTRTHARAKLDVGETPVIVDMGQSGNYACGVCGRRKRGHVCKGQAQQLQVAVPPSPSLPMPDANFPSALVSQPSIVRRQIQLYVWQVDRPGLEWCERRYADFAHKFPTVALADLQAYVAYFRAASIDACRCDMCFFPAAAGAQGDPAAPLIACQCGALKRHAACGGTVGWRCGQCA